MRLIRNEQVGGSNPLPGSIPKRVFCVFLLRRLVHKKVYLAPLATFRSTLHIRCRRHNERTFQTKMYKQIPDMVDYQVFAARVGY